MNDPVMKAKIMANRVEGTKRWAKARTGLPNNTPLKVGRRIWTEARRKARKLIGLMEEEGKFEPAAVVPGTDEAKAKAALEETCAIALGNGLPIKERLVALKTVLEFTKSKPESKSKLVLDKSEEWLAAVEADMKKDGRR